MNIDIILKQHKKSITQERREIFSFLEKNDCVSYHEIQWHFPHIGRASIFRTLQLFIEIWVLRKLQLQPQKYVYEIHHESHHEHMTCKQCGTIIHFEWNNICKLLFQKAQELNFQIDSHAIQIQWICDNCH